MKRLLSLGVFVAFIIALHGTASATTYKLHIRNVADTPIQFDIFQKAPGGLAFSSSSKEVCIAPNESRPESIQGPSLGTLQLKPTAYELVFRFKESGCAGHVTSTQRFTVTDPAGNYTINGSKGHYTITHH